MLTAELAEFLHGGVVVVAATRSAQNVPELTRGWGPRVWDDGTVVTLCLSTTTGSRTRENLEQNGTVAATFVLPTTYRGVQLKGEVTSTSEPTEDELRRVDEHLARLTGQTRVLGVPDEVMARLRKPPFVCVSFRVQEVYDQTPGPGAGARL
jgi:hypothetical protein